MSNKTDLQEQNATYAALVSELQGRAINNGDMTKAVYDADGDGIVEQADTITGGEDNPINNDIYVSGKIVADGNISAKNYSDAVAAIRLLASITGSSVFRISREGTTGHTYITANGTDIVFRVANGSTTGLTIGTDGIVTAASDIKAKRAFLSAPSSVTNSANVYIASSGQLCKSSSLRAIKQDIEEVTEEEAIKAYNLIPRAFRGINKGLDDHRQYGFVAEEVEEVLPDLATREDGVLNGVAYDRVCALLLKQNQMQKAEIETLKKRLDALEAKKGEEA